MPRMVRLDFPGTLVHVMARGIDGCCIFREDSDRDQFLYRLENSLVQCSFKCLAWCLMDTHYHLFLRTSEKTLKSVMKPLNGGYARWFNKKYGRRGYLFQDRFKSILCQDQEYARELIRYIHLNPVRGSEVFSLMKLKSWKWCGHAFLLGNDNARGRRFQDRTEALRRFGKTPALAVRNYELFLSQGIKTDNLSESGVLNPIGTIEMDGSFKGWPAVIGDFEFVKTAMLNHAIGIYRKHRKIDYIIMLEQLTGEIVKKYNLDREYLFRKARANSRSDARAELCYRAVKEELIPASIVARFLHMTISPVVRLVEKHENFRRNLKH